MVNGEVEIDGNINGRNKGEVSREGDNIATTIIIIKQLLIKIITPSPQPQPWLLLAKTQPQPWLLLAKTQPKQWLLLAKTQPTIWWLLVT